MIFFFYKVILLYFMMFVVLVIHELGHYFFAKTVLLNVKSVVIGQGKTLFRLGKFSFKIFPVSGYNDINIKELNMLSKIDKISVVMGGAIANITMGIFFMFLSVFFNSDTSKIYYFIEQNNKQISFGRLCRINNVKVNNVYDIKTIIRYNKKIKNEKTVKVTLCFSLPGKTELKEKILKLPMSSFFEKVHIVDINIPIDVFHSFILKTKYFFLSLFEKTKQAFFVQNQREKKSFTEKKVSSFNNVFKIEYILWITGILSFLTGILNLIPMKFGSQVSDGKIFLDILNSKEEKGTSIYHELHNFSIEVSKHDTFKKGIIFIFFVFVSFFIFNAFISDFIVEKELFEEFFKIINQKEGF